MTKKIRTFIFYWYLFRVSILMTFELYVGAIILKSISHISNLIQCVDGHSSGWKPPCTQPIWILLCFSFLFVVMPITYYCDDHFSSFHMFGVWLFYTDMGVCLWASLYSCLYALWISFVQWLWQWFCYSDYWCCIRSIFCFVFCLYRQENFDSAFLNGLMLVA